MIDHFLRVLVVSTHSQWAGGRRDVHHRLFPSPRRENISLASLLSRLVYPCVSLRNSYRGHYGRSKDRWRMGMFCFLFLACALCNNVLSGISCEGTFYMPTPMIMPDSPCQQWYGFEDEDSRYDTSPLHTTFDKLSQSQLGADRELSRLRTFAEQLLDGGR